jgi:hypothetical protein
MKMTETELLRFLRAEQQAAARERDETDQPRTKAIRAYLRKPYGTEQDGRSQVVASDVFDAIEGILPDLVDVFVSSDKAVVFDPVSEEDEEGAEQVTNACNHVFYKQNNGFMILYTAAKDALMLRTGGVKWCWEEKRTPEWTTYRAVDEMQLAAYLATNPTAEVVSQEAYEPTPEEQQQYQAAQQQAAQMGQQLPPMPPRFTVRIKLVKKRGIVRVRAIPPSELEISERHNSVLLDECPYVAHVRECTLSEVREMGYKVDVEDLKAAREQDEDDEYFEELRDWHWREDNNLDESMQRGWLREEYVLVDFDGDGIAERRKVVRLGNVVLENVEYSHVPIAAWTPYILQHRFEGLSVADLVEEFQRIRTDIWRSQLDNLDLANNQETVVTTDSQGNPLANIDDLLNRRPGGILREQVQGAIRPYVERWQGIEANPMLDALERAKQNRTGHIPGLTVLDADALNKTATQISKESNQNAKRMKMMARIMAEALVAPMFRGIFKTLSDYCMEKLSFRLAKQFVAYDPQEWRDGYDMSINVGIGNGDDMAKQQFLMMLQQSQFALMQSPYASLVDPKNVYNLQARLIETAGYKNPGEFITDPANAPPAPPPQPDPKMQIEQMKLQADAQKFQAIHQSEIEKYQADMHRQMMTDRNRQEYEARQKDRELEQAAQLEALKAANAEQARIEQMAFDKWKAELDAQVKLAIAAKPGNEVAPLKQQISDLMGYIQAPPKVIRDESGTAVGVEKAGKVYQIQRDEQGRAISLEG